MFGRPGTEDLEYKDKTLLPGRIRVVPRGPHRPRLGVLVHLKHLCLLTLLAELVSGIYREQHCFPLGLVRSIFLAVELDEPDVFLLHDQIAGVRTARENRWS